MQLLVSALLAISALSAAAGAQTANVEVQRQGSQPARPGPPANFTSSVRVEAPFQGRGAARVGGATVSFEPGARTTWHTHPLGQTLIVTEGCGLVQGEGAAVAAIRPGDVVWIPAGVRHWHGASPTMALTHVAIVEALDGKSVDWMEQVSDQHYSAGARSAPCGSGNR